VLPVLHVLTDDAVIARDDVARQAKAILEAVGERGALHLRAHEASARSLYTLAKTLAPVAASTRAWLVINDRVDVALAANIYRVQLTRRSLTLAEVQALRRPWEIGVSIHAPSEAAAAESQGADWIIAGHVFATPSHAGRGGGIPFIEAVAGATKLPIVAIGGIRPNNVRALRRAGAAGIAVIRGVWDADDAPAASTAYLTSYDAGGHE
jgi:thiazole tautomerase (transcriptional regulator TenI)